MTVQQGDRARVRVDGKERAARVESATASHLVVRLWSKGKGGAPKLNKGTKRVRWSDVIEPRRSNPAPGCEAVPVRPHSRKPAGGQSTGRCPGRRSLVDQAATRIEGGKMGLLAGAPWGDREMTAAMLDAEAGLIADGASQRAARSAVTRAARQAGLPERVVKARHAAKRRKKSARKPRPAPAEPTTAPRRRESGRSQPAQVPLFENPAPELPTDLEHLGRVLLGFKGHALVGAAAVRGDLGAARALAGTGRVAGSRMVVGTVRYRLRARGATPDASPIRHDPNDLAPGDYLVVGLHTDGRVAAVVHVMNVPAASGGASKKALALAEGPLPGAVRYVVRIHERLKIRR